MKLSSLPMKHPISLRQPPGSHPDPPLQQSEPVQTVPILVVPQAEPDLNLSM